MTEKASSPSVFLHRPTGQDMCFPTHGPLLPGVISSQTRQPTRPGLCPQGGLWSQLLCKNPEYSRPPAGFQQKHRPERECCVLCNANTTYSLVLEARGSGFSV